jgi:hypothetical protein
MPNMAPTPRHEACICFCATFCKMLAFEATFAAIAHLISVERQNRQNDLVLISLLSRCWMLYSLTKAKGKLEPGPPPLIHPFLSSSTVSSAL